MNKAEAKRLVYMMTAGSLRRVARDQLAWSKFRDWPKDMSDADKAKVKAEFMALADKLSSKFAEKEPIAGEATEVKE